MFCGSFMLAFSLTVQTYNVSVAVWLLRSFQHAEIVCWYVHHMRETVTIITISHLNTTIMLVMLEKIPPPPPVHFSG
jgi:hypothetical protein